jgi:glycosyltransferase
VNAQAPLISLVLSVKNGLPQLRKAIDAIRRQTYRNFEVIVQDGGSTDGSLQYLQSVGDLPKIEVVSQPDDGVGQAYNRGISRSHGDILCLTASDEYLDDDALEKGVAWFSAHPDAAVIYGAARLVDAEDRLVQIFFRFRLN